MYQIHCNREVSPLESHSILQRPFDLSLFLSFCKSSLTQFTPAAELLPVSGLEVAECRVLGSLFARQDADVYHLTLTSAPGRGCLQALAQCLAVRGKDTALAVLETPGQTSWRLALVRQATPRHCPPVLEGLLPVRCTALLCGSPRPNDALTPRLLRRICGCETVHQLRRAQEEDGLPRKLLFERCRTAWEQLSLALEDSTLLPSERSALPSLLVFQLTVLVLLEQRGIFGKDYPLQRWCSNAVLQGKSLFTSLLAPLLDGLSQGGDLPSLGLSGLPRLGELFAPWQGSAWRQENLMLPNRLFYDGKGNGFLEQLAGLPFDWNPPQADARLWAVNADDLGSVLERQEDVAVFRISDEGCGLPSGDVTQALTPYFSLKPENGQRAGLGLGLTNAYLLCQAMGGSILISSKENYGTTVLLRFPIDQSEDEVGDEIGSRDYYSLQFQRGHFSPIQVFLSSLGPPRSGDGPSRQ